MSILGSIIYGLVSGLAQFLPVSTQAHQLIVMQIFGVDQRDPIRDLLVHIALLAAVYIGCSAMFSRLRREHQIASNSRRGRVYDRSRLYDLRLVKTTALPLVICLFFYLSTVSIERKTPYICLFLLLNGIILFVSDYMRQGNKDARYMSGLDSILLGVFGGLSVLSGISRVGAMVSYSIVRGSDKQKALNWALLLSVPALAVLAVIDVICIFTVGTGLITFATIVGYILSAATAFAGGYLSIAYVRYMITRTGLSGFAYYSWGAALFSFILYLIT